MVSTEGPHTASYQYDPRGNQISGAGRSIDYTSFRKPSRIESGPVATLYGYSASLTRVRTEEFENGHVQKTIEHLGDAFEIIEEGGTTVWRHRVRAQGRSIGQVSLSLDDEGGAEWETNYFLTDHLGSTTVVTDAQGEVLERLYHDPFGQSYGPPGEANAVLASSVSDFAFTDQRLEAQHGLYDYGGRTYDPRLGRFLQADPIIPDVFDSQSINPYSYVMNDPLNFVDPSGYYLYGPPARMFHPDGQLNHGLHQAHRNRPPDASPVSSSPSASVANTVSSSAGSRTNSSSGPSSVGSSNASVLSAPSGASVSSAGPSFDHTGIEEIVITGMQPQKVSFSISGGYGLALGIKLTWDLSLENVVFPDIQISIGLGVGASVSASGTVEGASVTKGEPDTFGLGTIIEVGFIGGVSAETRLGPGSQSVEASFSPGVINGGFACYCGSMRIDRVTVQETVETYLEAQVNSGGSSQTVGLGN